MKIVDNIKLIIIYDNYNHIILTAPNFKNCIENLAEEFGELTELFQKALVGCETLDDYLNMFNLFSSHTINAIYQIAETIYEKE